MLVPTVGFTPALDRLIRRTGLAVAFGISLPAAGWEVTLAGTRTVASVTIAQDQRMADMIRYAVQSTTSQNAAGKAKLQDS